jgi:hypothetical protein
MVEYINMTKGRLMMKKLYMRLLVAAVALSAVVAANAIPLSQLVSQGGTITIGDKRFWGFSYSTTGPDAANIQAQAGALNVYTSSDSGGIYYLNFQGLVGTAIGGDLLLGYYVNALGGNTIDMIDQYYAPNTFNGAVSIGEIVMAGNQVVANSIIGFNDYSDPKGEAGDNLYINPPQSGLQIIKDIGFLPGVGDNGAVGGYAGLSLLVQSFHQPGVPDGGLTLALLGFGLFGIEGLRRRLAK